jgi:aspartyl-tRNA(Asn)/glutamyl-tRNA(Gln) amidotransferase subunit A
LKPASGEIPTAGIFPVSHSLDHVGLLTRRVLDATMLYPVLAERNVRRQVAGPLNGRVLGRLAGYFLERLDPEVRDCFNDATARLERAGARIVDITIRNAPAIPATYACIVLPELAALHAAALEASPEKFSETMRTTLERGRNIPGENYEQAQRDRRLLRRQVDAALTRCDALILSTLPIPVPKHGTRTTVIDGVEEQFPSLMLRLCSLFNLTGHPAISIPCGTTSDAMPCGLQIAATDTTRLLGIALSCEACLSPAGEVREPAIPAMEQWR